jgi:hypothetical protein
MTIGWLLGWAVPETWFEAQARAVFPGAAHRCFPASPQGLARLAAQAPFDWVAGYSLGALLLLGDPARANRCGRVALLAPIFAFAREAGLGGRVARAQVRLLARQLARDARGPVEDFYARAGLDVPADAVAGLLHDELLWGLARLEGDAVSPTLPPGWRAWCGAADPLLDAALLHGLEPAVAVVPGATHHPGELLRAFAAELGA